MLVQLITWTLQFLIVFGGVLPYVPQYYTIRRTRNAEGFSTYVCFVLVVSQILRVLFWIGRHYELALLLQSLVMIAMMLVMLHLCTHVARQRPHVVKRITDFKWDHFWKWTQFSDYCVFVAVLSVGGALFTWLLSESQLLVELLGFLSSLLEACLGMPQYLINYNKKSTQGMSVGMVLLWFVGDAVKTVYFIVRDSPLQFVLCGSLQCVVDIAILMQVCVY